MKKKRLKIFAAGSLAILMGASVLCGVLIAPMNSAQATISGATASSSSANLAGAGQLGDSALIADQQVQQDKASKELGINAETDPVVFTTADGLEIKKANDTYGFSANQTLVNNLYYFDMGTYSSKSIRWLILRLGTGTSGRPTDPAGSAVLGDFDKQIFANLTKDSSIPFGQLLCLSLYTLGGCAIQLNTASGATTKNFNSGSPGSAYYCDMITASSHVAVNTNVATTATSMLSTSTLGLTSATSYIKTNPYYFNTTQWNTYVKGTSYAVAYGIAATSTAQNYYTSSYNTSISATTTTNTFESEVGKYMHYTYYSRYDTDFDELRPRTNTTNTFYGQYNNIINSSGAIGNISSISIVGKITSRESTRYYNNQSTGIRYFGGTVTYYTDSTCATTCTSVSGPTIAYRPAMIVDFNLPGL